VPTEIDITRVLCALEEIADGGARGFTVGEGDWPLHGILVRVHRAVYAYRNHCPHAGHPLNLRPQQFLTPDGALLLCSSHGALFDKQTGFCIAGPCPGQFLTPIGVKVEAGYVMLTEEPLPQPHQ
jgi:nitrite reductase/ring-hydroxylating ferredoxin subunit